jgi:glycosyltransferase involved in cell wall biosynthesis
MRRRIASYPRPIAKRGLGRVKSALPDWPSAVNVYCRPCGQSPGRYASAQSTGARERKIHRLRRAREKPFHSGSAPYLVIDDQDPGLTLPATPRAVAERISPLVANPPASALRRVAFIGNSLPRRCGIATFTTDLQTAVASAGAGLQTAIVAMTDDGQAYDYPRDVRLQIRENDAQDYARAADFLNAERFDVVCLQHEFGIFGGEAGSLIITLLARLTMPIVTTLHTVLAEPSQAQRAVVNEITRISAKVIVMAEKGRQLLSSVYGVPASKIELIPHGIPDSTFTEPDVAKAALGFENQPIVLTFGLLSPNKGIEVMIDAMPRILKSCPESMYVVLGATHPHLVRREGEAYRERLMERTRAVGVENHVVFLNRFVDRQTLLAFIAMCDVYVTPYLHEAQMTSGTLAYSFGLGKAVVSTPYWHARELLADGRGVLVPFSDAGAIGAEIADLLTDGARRQAMRVRAYASSRSMTWEQTAKRYIDAFQKSVNAGPFPRQLTPLSPERASPRDTAAAPRVQLGHFLDMCDDTGLMQHALHCVPDRAHGYCLDDNARALLVACAFNGPAEQHLPHTLTARLAGFLQHAWNPDVGRFRNFMSFERRWLEPVGSEDSHGRALWALGECVRSDLLWSRRQWAADLFTAALPAVERFGSPRAWAFTLLGLNAYCAVIAADGRTRALRLSLATRLTSMLASVETPDWVWFEETLAYDNARLSQALITTGVAADMPSWTAAGIRSLRWLMSLQTSDAGVFRPVGSHSFGRKRMRPHRFDQQPLEASASISACLAAWRAEGDARWKTHALRAFAWFLGTNDLSVPLVDPETGGCRDGLHADRANENRGGESAVSYLLALAEIRQLGRANGERIALPMAGLHA